MFSGLKIHVAKSWLVKTRTHKKQPAPARIKRQATAVLYSPDQNFRRIWARANDPLQNKGVIDDPGLR